VLVQRLGVIGIFAILIYSLYNKKSHILFTLNLVDFIGMVFMIWFSLYGSVLLSVNLQSKGGTTKSDLFENTWVFGRDIKQEFFKKKSMTFDYH
jgi:hypothetical protein